ncbi:MAG: hypothetical protein RIA65_13925, partial [Woeseia sp.]
MPAILRVTISILASSYFFSDYFALSSSNPDFVYFARLGSCVSIAITAGLLIALMLDPAASVLRRMIGMLHDIAAISASLYLGEGAASAVAAIYLWVVLGNGFRYGNVYLYASAILSICSFGAVYLTSEYWRGQTTLSINIMLLLALIPPYVGVLLNSLHKAKQQLK